MTETNNDEIKNNSACENNQEDNQCIEDHEIKQDSNVQNDEKNELEYEISNINKKLIEKENELKNYVDIAQRIKAEFDNYKRRTNKEKEQLYTDIKCDIVSQFVPILDNLERAISSSKVNSDQNSIVDGIEMVLKQFKEILIKEGVEEIIAEGAEFDPNIHEAVMHIDDDAYGQNQIVEVFQKGYKVNEKVIRHSMVKVAN